MIHEVGNIELCELLETEPKTQCTVCLSYWNIGIVYCTCVHFLHKETEVNRKFEKYTMDLLSVPKYVIKKGRLHGNRYGKKPGDKESLSGSPIEEEMPKERVLRKPWPIPTRSRIPYSNDWKSSRWRTLSTMGCSCGWRSHSPFDSTRILRL